MRTPEQKVTFQLDRLNTAIAATARAQRKVLAAHAKKASALTYAANNIGHVERELADAERKSAVANASLPIAVAKSATEYGPSLNAAIASLSHAESALEAAASRVETARAKVEQVRNSAHVPSSGLLYARNLVEITERNVTSAKDRLIAVKAAASAAAGRYAALIDSAVAARDDFLRRQNDVQADYLEASDIVEYAKKVEHDKFMAEQKASQEIYTAERKSAINPTTVPQTDDNNTAN